MNPDEYGRAHITDDEKGRIASALAAIPSGKRGAFLVRADYDGRAVGHVVANIAFGFGKDNAWKVAAGVGFDLGEKRPAGYVAVEGAW